jgi:hypothetical protein
MAYKSHDDVLKYRREYYAKNRERILAEQRARWKDDPAYRTKKKEAHAAWTANNPEKMLTYSREWYARDIDNQRERCRETAARKVREKFGITEEAHKAMMAHGCEICHSASRVIDHCHATGKMRGGLCHKCNMGIGLFDDDGEKLASAIQYLEKHKK